jgi:DNA polymerase-3 subunit alpha
MEECKRMGLDVLGPDVNESNFKFTVNKKGAVRFGLGAIKGVGGGPVDAFVEERKENGPYRDIFDITKRVNLRKCNKKAFEGLALSGALDSFSNVHRAQYFVEENSRTFLANAIKFGSNHQESANSNQVSMFGEDSGVETPAPKIPMVPEWSSLQKLNKEKEVVGIYISGHPLDDYRIDIESFCNGSVGFINKLEEYKNLEFTLAAIITEVEHRHTRKGDPFGTIMIEDYNDSTKLFLFREDYGKFKDYMVEGSFIYMVGKVMSKRWNQNEFEFKVQKIDFLSSLRDQKASALELKVALSQVNHTFIEDMDDLFKEHEGKFQVKFKIFDTVNKLEIEMPSRALKIDINEQLLKTLSTKNIEYKMI